MPDLKISQLPVASTPLAGTELVPIVQSGVTDQTTVASFLSAGLPVAASTLSASSTATLSALTASTALALNASKEVVSVTNTGTGNNVLSASPTLTGTLAAAAATFSGNVTLGDATSDIISAMGRFDTDLVPSTDNARDLGTSTLRFRDAYFSRSVTADYIYASNIANVGSFTWNTATSSPAAATSVGSRVITPIHTGMRRCVVNDSGVVQYYLDPANSALKADGTASDLTGGDGQVMVEIPAFYTKREVSGTFITWSVSPVALPGYTLYPAFTKDGSAVDFRYYGAYDACVYDDSAAAYISGLNYDNNISPNGVAVDSAADKLASVSGVYPMVGLTRAECRTIAANRGSGWRQLDYTLFSAVQLLYLIEYQSFYSQNILGAGNTGTSYAASSGTQSDNGGSEAGKSNSIGNASTNTTNGASSASRGVAWMSYRGIENFYGNEWNWVDGVIVNAAGAVGTDAAVWDYTNNSSDFSDTVNTNMTQITTSGVTTSNYASAIASVDDFFIATSVSGGSSSTYTTDFFYGSASADLGVFVGGSASSGAIAGAFAVAANSGAASHRDRSIGARLAF